MERQAIKLFSGIIVGYYEIAPNGDKTIKDFSGRILGYYLKNRNVTTRFSGQVIAYGDVSGLFFQDKIRI